MIDWERDVYSESDLIQSDPSSRVDWRNPKNPAFFTIYSQLEREAVAQREIHYALLRILTCVADYIKKKNRYTMRVSKRKCLGIKNQFIYEREMFKDVFVLVCIHRSNMSWIHLYWVSQLSAIANWSGTPLRHIITGANLKATVKHSLQIIGEC